METLEKQSIFFHSRSLSLSLLERISYRVNILVQHEMFFNTQNSKPLNFLNKYCTYFLYPRKKGAATKDFLHRLRSYSSPLGSLANDSSGVMSLGQSIYLGIF